MRRSSGSSIVTKSGQVIDALTQAHRPLRFAEIVAQTGFVKSSCHRILAVLQGEHLIEYDKQSQTYRPGPRLQKWARSVWNRADIQQAAGQHMADLCDRTRMNTALSVLDADNVLYLRTVDFFNARFASHPGDRASLHATAAGKVFLAYMTPARRDAALDRMALETFTDFTVVARDALLAQCNEIKDQGFAIADREEALQVTGLAAPIWSGEGSQIACLSLWSSSGFHTAEAVLAQTDVLKEVAAKISAELGAP
jgi:DNA-binding IclR family transcriptional regulator